MSVESSRRSSCRSGSAWITASEDELAADPISPPKLMCGCKIPLAQKTSHTARNPARDFYQCEKVGTNENYICKTWIWVDNVRDYVEQMIKFRQTISLEKLNLELVHVRDQLAEKMLNAYCLEREMRSEITTQQVENSQLISQVDFLKSQISRFESAARRDMKLCMIILCAALYAILAPGSLAFPLVAVVAVAIMHLA